ncbi:MAG TPA: ParB/RepB/Spo0J family partition protein [Acidimicrobiales bacterium]|jgi:ParB family chromosome partitioning protein|nr:ParB/RepB/Spo0J family partition protein [Acidimicrobiales bacterium]
MARRSGLGKGLSALIPSEATGESDSLLRVVPISHIRPNAYQPRSHFDEESMGALAASIREVGLLQPVLVRQLEDEEDSYELIAGERRWRAARRAGLQTIPVLVQVADDVASLEQALVENLHRVDLNALEEAAAYQQLIDEFGLTHEQVATRMGKGRATVTNTLRLLQLPAGAQRALAERTISAGHARALLGTPDRALQEKMVDQIVEEGLTVRAVEELVRQGGADLRVVPDAPETGEQEPAAKGATSGTTEPSSRRATVRKLPEPGVLELEDLLSTYLNTRVKVDIQNRRGRLVVEFATLEDLERIYRAMVGDGGVA